MQIMQLNIASGRLVPTRGNVAERHKGDCPGCGGSTPAAVEDYVKPAWIEVLPEETLDFLGWLAEVNPDILDSIFMLLRSGGSYEFAGVGQGGNNPGGIAGGAFLAGARGRVRKTRLPIKAIMAIWDNFDATTLASDVVKCMKKALFTLKALKKQVSCKDNLGLLQGGAGGELCECLGTNGAATVTCATVVYAYRNDICKHI